MEKGNGNSEKWCDSSHINPTKGSEMKKLTRKRSSKWPCCMLSVLSQNVLTLKTVKMEVLKDQMWKNSVTMVEISKAVEFKAAEIKDCKRENAEMSKETAKLNKTDTEVRNRKVELERLKKR